MISEFSRLNARLMSINAEINKGIRNKYFYIGFVALLFSLVLNTMTEWGRDPNTQDVLYYYQVAHVQPLSLVSLSLSGLGGFLYLKEKENGFDKYCVIREGRKNYSRNTTLVSVLVGPMAVLAAETAFIALLRTIMPVCLLTNPVHENRIVSESFGYLLKSGHYYLFLLTHLFFRFMSSLFISSVSFTVAVVLNNTYTSISGCFIIYFLLCQISASRKIPKMINAYAVINGCVISGHPVASMIYTAVFTIFAVLICGTICIGMIKRGYK